MNVYKIELDNTNYGYGFVVLIVAAKNISEAKEKAHKFFANNGSARTMGYSDIRYTKIPETIYNGRSPRVLSSCFDRGG